MTIQSQTIAVKIRAKALGFDACAVALAEHIDPEDKLGQWLDAGMHADMEWMARTKAVRQDPQLKLAGTKSVVVVARNYFSPRPDAAPNSGRVSRYAWGRDYHRVLLKPLKQLAAQIESFDPQISTYCCIDSGPVMEKAWAARAGLGWIGKNSLVLQKDLGSYFFIGAILTTMELASDSPVGDQCGGCTLCLDACPTGAIVQPRVVDSNRCISYHTIENRGEIPSEIKNAFGPWIFGCDICQDVCPWNRRVHESTEREFHPRSDHANPSLEQLAAMNDAEFLREFAGTPIMRAKWSGMRRNVELAAENLPTPDQTGTLFDRTP